MVPARPSATPIHQIIAQRGQQARAQAAAPRPQPRVRAAPVSAFSPLAVALEARGRRFRIFPFPGLKSGFVGVLYAAGSDVQAALFAAHKSLADLAAKGSTGLPQDADAIAGAKTREILYALTCEALDADRLRTVQATGKPYPAFPSTRWMAQWLSPDDESALMHLVAEVRAEFAPRGSVESWEDAAEVDAVAGLLADGAASGADLAHLDRAVVTSLCVALSRRLADVTRARDALLDGT